MYSNRDVCTDALRKIGVVAQDQTATADEMKTATGALFRLLSSWQNKGYSLWLVQSRSIPLTTAISYTLSNPRPIDLQTVTLNRSGIETQMHRMNRHEYDSLPNKSSTGLPTTFYFDRQRDEGVIYVWPPLATAGGETLEVTYVRPTSDVDLDADVDVPPEWYEATVYGLAARLADDFTVDAPMVTMRAESELDDALTFDREGSLYFVDAD